MFWFRLMAAMKHPLVREIAIALLRVFANALLDAREGKKTEEKKEEGTE